MNRNHSGLGIRQLSLCIFQLHSRLGHSVDSVVVHKSHHCSHFHNVFDFSFTRINTLNTENSVTSRQEQCHLVWCPITVSTWKQSHSVCVFSNYTDWPPDSRVVSLDTPSPSLFCRQTRLGNRLRTHRRTTPSHRLWNYGVDLQKGQQRQDVHIWSIYHLQSGVQERLDQMTDDYKIHIQMMIKKHSTWDGVPQDHNSTHRNVDGVLTPKESWEKQPLTI